MKQGRARVLGRAFHNDHKQGAFSQGLVEVLHIRWEAVVVAHVQIFCRVVRPDPDPPVHNENMFDGASWMGFGVAHISFGHRGAVQIAAAIRRTFIQNNGFKICRLGRHLSAVTGAHQFDLIGGQFKQVAERNPEDFGNGPEGFDAWVALSRFQLRQGGFGKPRLLGQCREAHARLAALSLNGSGDQGGWGHGQSCDLFVEMNIVRFDKRGNGVHHVEQCSFCWLEDRVTEVRDALRDVLPVASAIAPYSAVFGALALDQGMSLSELLITSGSIYAVASQYVMLDGMLQGLPLWSVLLAVLAVNFRHVLYSAASVRWLGHFSRGQRAIAFFFLVDPQYATCESRHVARPITPTYYFTYALFMYSVWMLSNLMGALFGKLLGDVSRFGLDLILPMFFAVMVMGFRHKSRFGLVLCTSVGVSVLAFFTIGSPWHITLGGLAGILLAAVLSKPHPVGEAQHV